MDHRPTFATVPTDAQLRTVPRDLRYHPSPVRTPRTLSPDQVARFDRDGHLSGLRIFSPDEIAGHRAYFDDLLARVLAAGGDSYSISTAHLRYAPVYDLLLEPRIVAVVRDLLGDDVVAWGAHYFCKMPGDGKVVDWHQDASYWPLTPSKTVTVWLAIDDARVDNACMRYIPGTHRLGHLTYALNEGASDAVLPQSVAGAESLGTPIDVELDAGMVAIHSDLLLHGSRANTSTRRRCGLTLRYCAADVRAGLGWAEKGTLVAGRDRDGHWGNPPRPMGR
ncbi:MAG: phytanoyl-CoA dioxygenase family protein [Planctomycetes bacterium]|nr:phytanoyl-CoA dioxygenase family protein [Planctomycetota bacterium]